MCEIKADLFCNRFETWLVSRQQSKFHWNIKISTSSLAVLWLGENIRTIVLWQVGNWPLVATTVSRSVDWTLDNQGRMKLPRFSKKSFCELFLLKLFLGAEGCIQLDEPIKRLLLTVKKVVFRASNSRSSFTGSSSAWLPSHPPPICRLTQKCGRFKAWNKLSYQISNRPKELRIFS